MQVNDERLKLVERLMADVRLTARRSADMMEFGAVIMRDLERHRAALTVQAELPEAEIGASQQHRPTGEKEKVAA